MVDQCRVMVYLSSQLLTEVDEICQADQVNRSEIVREAMRMYIMERTKKVLREQLREGYQIMADLNLLLAEEGCDEEVLEYYERQLAEAD